MLRYVLLLILLTFPCLPQSLFAQEQPANFSTWVAQFKVEAAKQGISPRTIDLALREVRFLPGVLDADRHQPEFKKSLNEYLADALSQERISQGRLLLHRHWNILQKIAGEYRVQPQYLVALWGIETGYGRHTGKVPIVSALATLAYDARRSDYFRRELLNLLRIIDSGKLARTELLGSWAGAMGQLQFMPSTFLAFAVDGDGDGFIDLWENRADYLPSAANYLRKSGWQWRQKWGRQVSIPPNLADDLTGLNTSASLEVWRQRGVRQADGRELPRANINASLIVPEGGEGEAFLVYENYRVLLRWNKAHSFALAVGQLADLIAAGDN